MKPLLLCLMLMPFLIFRPPKMCSSMMGGLSVDTTLMESLTPEPFTNVGYFLALFLKYSVLILFSTLVVLVLFLFQLLLPYVNNDEGRQWDLKFLHPAVTS